MWRWWWEGAATAAAGLAGGGIKRLNKTFYRRACDPSSIITFACDAGAGLRTRSERPDWHLERRPRESREGLNTDTVPGRG